MKLLTMLKAMLTPAPRLTPAECSARVRAGSARLIDVREPGEWAGGVAEHAVLLPLSDLTGSRLQWQSFLASHQGSELLLYCAAGGRSAIAARLLAQEGFKAVNAGSLTEWRNSGWPIVPPAAAQG